MSLEERIVEKLEKRGLYLTTAESCTAGLLAGRIMNVSGASSVYKEGYITYANESKEKLLHVRHETLEQYGAVSTQTAEEMAEGAAKAAALMPMNRKKNCCMCGMKLWNNMGRSAHRRQRRWQRALQRQQERMRRSV